MKEVNDQNIPGPNNVLFLRSDFQAVPEPATLLLLASGLVALAGGRRKFKKNEPDSVPRKTELRDGGLGRRTTISIYYYLNSVSRINKPSPN